MVFFNASTQPITYTDAILKDLKLHLHPVQQRAADPVVRQSTSDVRNGTAIIPAWTTVVFVADQE